MTGAVTGACDLGHHSGLTLAGKLWLGGGVGVAMSKILLAAGLLQLALAACSDTPPEQEEEATTAAPPVYRPAPATDRAQAINLAIQALTPADLEQAAIAGELACSFAPGPGGEMLFLGRADVRPEAGAQGVVKLPEGIRVLAMDATGGFQAMNGAARFIGDGVSVEFALTGGQTPQGVAQSPAFPATMTVRSGDDAIAVQGIFECGP